MTPCIKDVLQQHSKQLEAALNIDSSSARIEVQCLLQAVLQVNRAWLLTHPEQSLAADQHSRYMALLERRLGGEPIAYLLGEREFYGLTFKAVSYTHLRAHETRHDLVCRLLLEKKKNNKK